MPYINSKRRNDIQPGINSISLDIQSIGELNYAFTTMILNYLEKQPKTSYKDLNEIIGVLECCKLEVYRKLVARYEDQKCIDNGEIF